MSVYAYVMLEVGGIQKYILSAGKLKEMIGGSELIESLTERSQNLCNNFGLKRLTSPASNGGMWYVPLQEAAGTLRLLMSDRTAGQRFLTAFSEAMLTACSGLPLYGACVDCLWTTTGLQEAAEAAKKAIAQKRGQSPLPPKMLWPFCRVAPLDGLPAVAKEKRGDTEEYLSALSVARRSPVESAQKRLQNVAKKLLAECQDDGTRLFADGTTLQWMTDLDEMLEGAPVQRVALIHIDGNDLGKEFRTCLTSLKGVSPEEQVAATTALSNLVDTCNKEAFAIALCAAVKHDCLRPQASDKIYTVPARPLVLGGDDVTVVVRADLAFSFVSAYATEFEKLTKNHGKPLTVGAGMVLMPTGYPFSRAFHLAEQLTENAKKMTAGQTTRPSSVDYLVITSDVDTDLSALREHIATAKDGAKLTGKPFYCGTAKEKNSFHLERFLVDAELVLNHLPASGTRSAISECRSGKAHGQRAWKKMLENLQRGLGGRHNTRMLHEASFKRIFNNNFFVEKSNTEVTLLGDYLELRNMGLFVKGDD